MKNFRFLMRNRFAVTGFFFAVLLGCSCSCGTVPETNSSNNVWVATWSASPFAFLSFDNSPGPGPFNDQTVRQSARISIGGDQVRVRFSNDIGSGGMTFPGTTGPAPSMRTGEDIIAGYRQLIARTHAVSPPVKIYGATLTPFEGTFAGYYSPEKDKIRMAVNEWIRTGGEFDGVIDFDKAVQDPDNPLRMAPEYDSGDKLHPGDAGYRKMAESIDLNLFE
jgi:hypothetical protein